MIIKRNQINSFIYCTDISDSTLASAVTSLENLI